MDFKYWTPPVIRAVRLRSLATLCVILASCRDADPTFLAPRGDFQKEGEAIRLTYSEKDDRMPFWNAAGDSIYYIAATFDPLPGSNGLLARIDRVRGIVSPAVEDLQVGASFQPWYIAAATTRDFKQIVTLEVDVSIPEDTFCITAGCHAHPPVINGRLPFKGSIRVQSIDARTRRAEHLIQELLLPRATVDSREVPEVMRPSLSPDSQRVAFGDRQFIFIWNLKANRLDTLRAGSAPVAGGWLSWSPDGQWLAFTAAGDAMYIIHPDGTGQKFLGEGLAPAWTPDSKALVFTRAANLWRAQIDGAGVKQIPNALFGYEPAVSSDGNWIAFARMNEPWNHDIWLTKMP